MRGRWLVPLLALVAIAGTAQATHDTHTLPLLHEGPGADALTWLEEERVTDEGCVHDRYDEDCYVERTKWLAVSLGHTGIDPGTWPTADGSTLDWLQERSDDLRDEALVDCERDDDRSQQECAHERVYSLAKGILAFQAAGDDARSVPVPNGGERDLVAELTDEHTGSEFGRNDHANDDIWALAALNAASYEGPEVADALDRIEAAQGVSGGVSHDEAARASVDVTAAALMALAPHDRPSFVEDARSYLADEQIASGEHRACWRYSSAITTEANTESTAWALQAVAAIGEDPADWSVDDRTPAACLATFQADEGGFRHSGGAKVQFMPTHQALAAFSWQPYGAVDGPTSRLTVTDEATAGEQHTARVPDALLRLGIEASEEHTWTPEEPGQRVFHGFTEDTMRPVELVVDVREGSSRGSSGSSGTDGSTGSTSDSRSSTSDDTQPPPTADLQAPAEAERNVTFTVNATGEASQAPVTAFRIETPGRDRSDWQPTGAFELTFAQLGEHTIQAWARDAEGRVSEPAEAIVTVVDATPRITIEGPDHVNRSTAVAFHTHAEDPDGPEPTITWTGPDGDERQGDQATFAFADPGEHTIQAHARDAANGTANATWSLQARNQAPTNLSVEPGELAANTTEVLHAQAHDPEGDPLEITWRPPGQADPTSRGAQLHLETGPPGERTLIVNASDPHGGWTSGRITLPVREQPGEEPSAALANVTTATAEPTPPPARPSPAEPATVDLSDEITVPANASRLLHLEADSPAGDVVNVTVALGGPLPVRGTASPTAILPELPPGEYELAARAADRAGWGPWSNTTLVVEGTQPSHALDQADQPSQQPTPLGIVPLLAAIAAAGRLRG